MYAFRFDVNIMIKAELLACAVAIARDEESFIDEWIIYHLSIGINYIYIYDDSPSGKLAEFLAPHFPSVVVIPWYGRHQQMEGRNRQTKAYMDAVKHHIEKYEWVAFIDIDEYIVLRDCENLGQYLGQFGTAAAISLNWHQFGHNGFFDNPRGLITQSLTRRRIEPSEKHKSITRTSAITGVTSPHSCDLAPGSLWVDGNGRHYSREIYPGLTAKAHINHYRCRSFFNWMQRAHRGDCITDQALHMFNGTFWSGSEQNCKVQLMHSFELLKRFITEISHLDNEHVDEYMARFADKIRVRWDEIQLKREERAARFIQSLGQ